MTPVKYSDINLTVPGKYLLETGEYLQVRIYINSGIHHIYYKDVDFTIYHRENDLPAVIMFDVFLNPIKETWYFDGMRHRVNGSSIRYCYPNLYQFHLFGVEYTKDQYDMIIDIITSCNISTEEIFQSLDILK